MNIDPSISALHYDGNHNLLVVLSGTKTVTLVSPAYTNLLNPGAAYSTTAANHANCPGDTETYFGEHNIPVVIVEVNEGDAVFIPEGIEILLHPWFLFETLVCDVILYIPRLVAFCQIFRVHLSN